MAAYLNCYYYCTNATKRNSKCYFSFNADSKHLLPPKNRTENYFYVLNSYLHSMCRPMFAESLSSDILVCILINCFKQCNLSLSSRKITHNVSESFIGGIFLFLLSESHQVFPTFHFMLCYDDKCYCGGKGQLSPNVWPGWIWIFLLWF